MSSQTYYRTSDAIYKASGDNSISSASSYRPYDNCVKTCEVPGCGNLQGVISRRTNGDMFEVCHFCNKHMYTHIYEDEFRQKISLDWWVGLTGAKIKEIVSSHTYVKGGFVKNSYYVGIFVDAPGGDGYKYVRISWSKECCASGEDIVHYTIIPIKGECIGQIYERI